MAGHQSFSNLTAGFSPEQRERTKALSHLLAAEMEMAEVRKALGLSQADVAHSLGTGQDAVPKLEGGADLNVGTLRQYVEALGGRLRLMVDFGGGHEVEIKPPAAAS